MTAAGNRDVGAVRDVLDEVNAAIGAALSTHGVPGALEAVLYEVQCELLDLADDLDGGTAPREPEALRRAATAYAPPTGLPRGFAVLAGFSGAAGLLKLARSVAIRGSRTVTGEALDYLRCLADVLLAAAWAAERGEQDQVPLGVCGGAVVGPA